jgi:N-acetylmuramoyl-L-alanine amidase
MSKYIYLLDPGHGGIDPVKKEYVTSGKRSPKWSDGTQYFEGVGNRDIAKLIGEKLTQRDIEFKYIVKPEEWKDVSLETRCLLANQLHKANKRCIYISIHSNGADQESANGFEVWTSPGQTKSDEYADIMFEETSKLMKAFKARKDTKDGDPDKEAKFYVLVNTKCPSVLLESAFHTNEKECKFLMSSEGKHTVADILVNTIMRIENEK